MLLFLHLGQIAVRVAHDTVHNAVLDLLRINLQDNDFEEDVQTALVHTDKVRPIQAHITKFHYTLLVMGMYTAANSPI